MTLPTLDRHRLDDARRLALRVLLAERQDMLHGLRESGVEIVHWAQDPDAELTALRRVGARGVIGVHR